MFKDVFQWRMIRAQVLKAGISKNKVMRDTGIQKSTLEKGLKHPFPQPYCRRRRRSLTTHCQNPIDLPSAHNSTATHYVIEFGCLRPDDLSWPLL